MKKCTVHLLFFYLFCLTPVFCQTDNIGSGKAINFDGIDDLIDLGDTYHDINLPFSVSAWIYIDPSVTYPVPIFVSNDNNPIYRGFWFFINQSMIWCEFGDGTGGSTPDFRRGKQAAVNNVIGRWINVCAVMKAPFDITLYVNGIDVGGQSMGSSNLSMASSFSGDHPKIGYFLSNNVTYRFKGVMDEVRLWNKPLTQSEIRDGLCKSLSGNESNLIGYWNFNEVTGGITLDKSVRSHSGTLIGNPTRVFSGAPLGEVSLNTYRTDWTSFSFEIADGENKLVASNVKNGPEGIHLYKVTSSPSQTAGLSTSLSNKPYFGVFLASLDNDNSFDASYLFQGKSLCKTFMRNDNSSPSWVSTLVPVINKLQRGEFVKGLGTVFTLNLGADLTTCTNMDVILDTRITDPEVSLLWSTGQTTSSIKVNAPGKYWVKAENSCGIAADTLKISLLTPPPSFSLGDNQTLCEFDPVLLKPYPNSTGYQFTWQDNSTGDSFIVKEFGEYSVTVKNACGEASSAIAFSQTMNDLSDLPNVITPNGDPHNEFFVVAKERYSNVSLLILNRWGKQVYHSNDYKDNWSGQDLASGTYFYTITGSCINPTKGSITIVR